MAHVRSNEKVGSMPKGYIEIGGSACCGRSTYRYQLVAAMKSHLEIVGLGSIAARVAMPAAVTRCTFTRLPALLAGLGMYQGFSHSASAAVIVGKQLGMAMI